VGNWLKRLCFQLIIIVTRNKKERALGEQLSSTRAWNQNCRTWNQFLTRFRELPDAEAEKTGDNVKVLKIQPAERRGGSGEPIVELG
jgi:hypothetical protein